MKHILKVASLENLPDTRPLIAMNDNGDLKLLTEVAPSIEMVDLGLTSGTLWAKYNIGATCENTAESWYGGFYAWGETETKSNYDWSTYKFGTSDNLTKYNSADKLNVLQPEDDVVTVTYGSNYRMPTKAELEELKALPNQWVTNYNGISGLNGRVFTGTNGNTLFIPAAGIFDGSTHYSAGSDCSLWYSSLYNPGNTWYLYFNSGNIGLYYDIRYYGFSVRAVRTAN